MKKFIHELGAIPSSTSPIPLLCDNNGAIAQAKEPRAHSKSKHIERKYHVLREIVGRGDVLIQKVASAENVRQFCMPLASIRMMYFMSLL